MNLLLNVLFGGDQGQWHLAYASYINLLSPRKIWQPVNDEMTQSWWFIFLLSYGRLRLNIKLSGSMSMITNLTRASLNFSAVARGEQINSDASSVPQAAL